MMIGVTFRKALRSGNFQSSPNVRLPRLSFILLFICLKLLIVNADAQLPKGFSIEPSLHFGRIAKHTPKLLFQSPPSVWAAKFT